MTSSAFPAADLERRATAFAVDRLLVWGVAAGLGFAAWKLADTGVGTALGVTVGVVVLLGLISAVLLGTTGLGPGKAALGLRVVRQADGRPIGVLAALARTIVLGIAGLPTLALGAATLGWTAAMDPTRRRRALHDRIGDAVVVDVRPRPADGDADEERPQQLVNLTALRLLPPPAASAPTPPRPLLPPAPAPAAPPAPAGWRVTFDTGASFLVEGMALVGRRPEARSGEPVRHVVPLPSDDMSLSKTHAQFQVTPDGALVVMDRGSTNGSYVVRQGLSKALTPGRATTLLDGDVVRFGDRTMRVERLT